MRDSVKRQVSRGVRDLLGNKKYLAAVIVIGDDNRLHLLRETNQFPVADFNTALTLLRDSLNDEITRTNDQLLQEQETNNDSGLAK